MLWIWRSQAFCESHEWYIAIGRCVMAWSGYAVVSTAASSSGACQNGSGSNQVAIRSRRCSGGWRPAVWPFAARRNACSVSL